MDKVFHSITQLLHRASDEDRVFPATLLFEEGWLLRLVLQWFADARPAGYDLSFLPGARWFSEARLVSAFLPRHRGDLHGEGYTHADGVVGHFKIGKTRQAELALEPNAQQLIVTEAKMFSPLSKGTTRAPTYNQAARNIACMAELIRRANRDPSQMSSLAFFVLAPAQQLNTRVFADCMEKASIEQVVRERVRNFDPTNLYWFERWFLPTLGAMHVCCLPWEGVIAFIKSADGSFGSSLEVFYERCLEFNRLPDFSARS
jgi:hypothetical protein